MSSAAEEGPSSSASVAGTALATIAGSGEVQEILPVEPIDIVVDAVAADDPAYRNEATEDEEQAPPENAVNIGFEDTAAIMAIAGMSEEEVDRVAAAEGLRLVVAATTGGYKGVKKDKHCPSRPYNAQIKKDGHCRSLGYFATAKEAALAYARAKGPKGEVADALAAGQAAIGAAAALEETEEDRLAHAEGLTLLREDTPGGYKGVRFCGEKKRRAKPYEARIWREGKTKTLGRFATAKAAALCYARAKAAQNAVVAHAQPLTDGATPSQNIPMAMAVRIL